MGHKTPFIFSAVVSIALLVTVALTGPGKFAFVVALALLCRNIIISILNLAAD